MVWPWFKPKNESSYKIFTTEFDRTVDGNVLSAALSADERQAWKAAIAVYEAETELTRGEAAARGLKFVDAVKRDSGFDPSRTSVSILVDHSGSLRGQRAVMACLATEVAADFLSRVGVQYEILGFTTAEWRGGQSRKRWLQMGRPPKPGRLCDLLHIVYRAASDTRPGAPYGIRHLLRGDLLKENVDGEALLWASERMKTLGLDRNVIVVISDGAPVDDSTLNENPPDVLWRHLHDVIDDLRQTPGFTVTGIGIDYQLDKLYPNSLTIATLEQISSELPSYLSSLLR